MLRTTMKPSISSDHHLLVGGIQIKLQRVEQLKNPKDRQFNIAKLKYERFKMEY